TSMDIFFCNLEGWPGIRHPKVKDWLVKHQISADAWYVASPNLTVAGTRRPEKGGKALDEFLDKMSNKVPSPEAPLAKGASRHGHANTSRDRTEERHGGCAEDSKAQGALRRCT